MASSLSAKRRSHIDPRIWITLIVSLSGVVVAAVKILPRLNASSTESHPSPTRGSERVVGSITDRAGNPLNNVTIGIKNNVETTTDQQGNFVLNGVPSGDQLLVARTAGGGGALTQNLAVEKGKTTHTRVIYDPVTSNMGVLSITEPIDGALLDIRGNGADHWAMVYGRCDGMAQLLGKFDIWLAVNSEHDTRYWIQHPPAIIDAGPCLWRAKVIIGSAEYPPRNGERWNIVALGVSADSQMGRVVNTPRLSMLPSHIASNAVTVETRRR
ncbi:MAG TPA: carboxypeptidase-like regulatory domain-containing protein [Pyrinomonadaceae bacterium]|nr:carboxypeptidase-like regulatory domain-containing protein [Pyrinomonadaceae bacterium]